jgi:branched-subunit amino acid transport protein
MSIWWVMIFAGLFTFLMRLSFILLIGRRDIPSLLSRTLRFIPPAVLSAIVFPELFLTNGEVNISIDNARLIAGVIAIVIAWKTKSVVWTILSGMFSLWLIQSLLR